MNYASNYELKESPNWSYKVLPKNIPGECFKKGDRLGRYSLSCPFLSSYPTPFKKKKARDMRCSHMTSRSQVSRVPISYVLNN